MNHAQAGGRKNRNSTRYLEKSAVAAFVAAMVCTASAGAAESEDAELEEVTVTAERRSTNLQDTPLSIQVLSGEALEQKGLADVADVALYTPNLGVTGGRGSGNNAPIFSIRGISGGGGATSERGVALYIDDIYVPRTSGSVFRVFDLERVEVLRGPQGTLFGRNSEGGAVRLITKQPTNEQEGYLRTDLGNMGHRDFIGMLNLPATDNLALRFQVARLEEDGHVTRGPEKLGGSKDWVARVQAAIQLSEATKLTLSGLYSYSKSQGSPNVMREWNMSPGINGDGVPASQAIQGNYADWISDWLQSSGQARLAIIDDPRIVKGDYEAPDFCFLDDSNPDWDEACAQRNDNRYRQVDARLGMDLTQNTRLSASAGYATLDHIGVTDWQYLGTENRPTDVHSDVFNAEVLLNSSLWSGKVDLVTGINAFQEKSSSSGGNLTVRGTSVFSAAGGSANSNGYAGQYLVANLSVAQKVQAAGLFANATWHVTDKFNFTGGLRVSHDTKDIEYLRLPGSGPAPTFTGMSPANDFVPSYTGANGATSITVNGDDSWTELDWRATLDYHLSDDFMAYATVSKAFKGGQFSHTVVANISGPNQSSIIKALEPERVINYEAGLRTSWLGGRLRFNPTGYYMSWSNRQSAQQQACPGDPSCPTGFRIVTVNSGNVDVWGVEVDAQFALTRRLTLQGAVGTTKYRLDAIKNAGPALFPDQAMPQYNLGLNYRGLATERGEFSYSLNYAYRGPQQTHPTIVGDSASELPSYGLWNTRLQWTSSNNKNVVALYANNLLDKVYGNYATRFGGGFWDSGPPAGRAAPQRSAMQWVMGRPREIGISLQHHF